MNDDVELLIDFDGSKYYVLKNSNLPELPHESIAIIKKILRELNNKLYYKNKLIHRKDGPAIEYNNGTKKWYKNGMIHRKDGPAVEDANGDKLWYQYGLLHRENGPAVEYVNGYKAYWLNEIQISEENFYLEKELRESIINNNISKKNKI